MKKVFTLAALIMATSAFSISARDFDKLISTPGSSLVVSGNYGEAPRLPHYGAHLDSDGVKALYSTKTALNRPAYPALGDETNMLTSLQIVQSDGNLTTMLATKNIETIETPRGPLTTFTLHDSKYPVEVKLNYLPVKGTDVIEQWVEITNEGQKPIRLRRMDSGFLPIRQGDVWVSHLHGSWAAENNVTSEPLTPGVKTIRNLDGARNGQNDQPGVMISLDGEPRENSGRVIGATLCWSGNYELRFDTENNKYHHFMAGISPEGAEYVLDPGKTFDTPRLALTYSEEGLSGASRNFHKWARAGAVHGGDRLRDVLLNSWEGVYLNVDEKKMNEMMRDFAQLGGELFVMDDGWFGDKYPRKEDNSSLGDWVTDRKKLPNDIAGLVKGAKKNGIKFGIWIEPECTNTISELYENHPDWVLRANDRDLKLTRGGTQLLLDLSNPEVQDFVFGVVDNLMTANPDIAYIKWDANTAVKNYGSTYLPADRQLQFTIDYHKGLEKTLQRIREKYPDLVIQACGSGGGRANYGIMPYFDEIWVSDNTDALQRIYMQWGASMFYPSIIMAQHVSASPNHQTRRVAPMKFRFDVAMTGRLGMEMQPSDMNAEEKEFARKAIADYKRIRPVIQLGDQYRLISPYSGQGVASLMYVSPEKDEAVFFAYKLDHFHNQTLPRFMMAGLDPDKTYTIEEINVAPGEKPSSLNGKSVRGRDLMNLGVELSLGKEYASRVYKLSAAK